jgi:hypothetical protein
MDKVKKFLNVEDVPNYPHKVLQTMNYDRKNRGIPPM